MLLNTPSSTSVTSLPIALGAALGTPTGGELSLVLSITYLLEYLMSYVYARPRQTVQYPLRATPLARMGQGRQFSVGLPFSGLRSCRRSAGSGTRRPC